MRTARTATDDVQLYYEITGAGEAIIFAHEFADDCRSWRSQVAALSDYYRCVTYNARGYEPSDVPEDPSAYHQMIAADDIARVLDDAAIEAAHVVGLSMGSMASLHFARRHPDRARSLVLAGCGPGARAEERAAFQSAIEAFESRIEEAGLETVAREYGRSPARAGLARKEPEAWRQFVDRFAGHSARGALLTLRHVIAQRPWLADLADDLGRMVLPVLILTGDGDEGCLETSLFLKRTLPGAQLAIIPNTGHAVNLEEPAAFNRTVRDFLALVEGGRWPVGDDHPDVQENDAVAGFRY